MVNPKVLVHGYIDNWWTPWWLRNKLKLEKEYNADVSIVRKNHLPLTNTRTFVENAKNVQRACKKYESNVDIIAHSMGGIDSRWYIERLSGSEKVDNLVTLGTPHQGTKIAYLGYLTTGGRHMLPNSEQLNKLNTDGISDDVNYTSFWSNRDEAVYPRENAKLPFTQANNIEISKSHLTMQMNIYDLINSYDEVIV